MTQRRVLAIIAAVAVLSAGVTWAAASTLQSPDERAASTEAPEAGPVAVPVESRTVRSGLVGRATILFEDALGLEAGAGGGGEGGGGGGAGTVVTTAPPDVGTEVGSGEAVFAVAGRPTLVLTGRLPAWRDMVGGDTGPDVEQLQAALVELGRLTEQQADGTYGAATASAIEAVYAAAGYPAPERPDGSADALDTAIDSLDAAEQALAQARRSSGGDGGPLRSQRLQAEAAVNAAADALQLARATRQQALEPLVAAAEAQRVALDEADADLEAAREALDELEQQEDPPAGDDELAAARQAVAQAEQARAEVAAARAEALDVLEIAQLEQDAQVEQAEAQLAIARAQLDELLSGAGGIGGEEDGGVGPDIDALVADRDRAADAVAEARLAALTPFRQAEVAFVPRLPRLVQSRSAEVGDLADGAVATLAGARLTASVPVPTADLDEVTEGQSVVLDDGEVEYASTVTSIPSAQDGNTVEVTLTLTDDDLDANELEGRNLRATFSSGDTREDVLAVPLAALGSDTDGRERVLVVDGDDDTDVTSVVVEAGEADGGMVEVVPVEEGTLAAGDLVVVG